MRDLLNHPLFALPAMITAVGIAMCVVMALIVITVRLLGVSL